MATRIPGFGELLVGLMSIDNVVRNRAEKEFHKLKGSNPASTMLHLLEVLNNPSAGIPVRSLSAVLLRGALTKNNDQLYFKLDQNTQGTLKTQLLASLMNENDVGIRRKTCDTVGELGRGLVDTDSNEWPELVQYVLTNVTSESKAHRETAFLLFEKLCVHISNKMVSQYNTLNQVFKNNLSMIPNDKSLTVQVAAIRAWATLIITIGNAKDRSVFTGLVPDVIKCLQVTIENGCTHEATEILKVLIDVCVEEHTKIFKTSLNMLLPLLTRIISSKNLESSPRQLALELVVTLVETKPAMLRKIPENGFVNAVVPAVFSMMLELEDFGSEYEMQQWANSNDDDDDGDSEPLLNFCTAAAGLDRIACGIGGETVLPLTFQLVSQYASSPQWQNRHAALVAISQISEVIIPTFQDKLGEIITTILQFMNNDPHPKVRSAAVSAIGNMCVDCQSDLQEDFHAIVLPALLRRLEEDIPRLQARSATAIEFFVDGCPPALLDKYLEGLLEKLFKHLGSDPMIVQDQVIAAISSIAYKSEARFEKYYPHCVPILKQLVVSEMPSMSKKQTASLRAKVIECIATIGKAAGKKMFKEDSLWLMKALDELQRQPMDDDDPQRTCIFSAWCSICECLGQEFEPYLGLIMPSLLKTAQIQIDYEAIALQEEEGLDEDEYGESGVDFVNNVRTSDIDEKITACSMLAHLSREMGPAFFPFVKDTAQVLGPLCLAENELYEDIRHTSVAVMPDLIACVSQRFDVNDPQRSMVKEIMEYALAQLLNGLQSDPDIDVLKTISQSISSCVSAGLQVPEGSQVKPADTPSSQRASLVGNLSAAQIEKICESLLQALKASLQRRAVAAAERQLAGVPSQHQDGSFGFDFDDEDEKDQLEIELAQEEELQLIISQALGALFPLYKDTMMPIVEKIIVGPVLDMSHPKRLASDRKFSVFVIDDIIEHLAPYCASHVPKFINILMASTCDPDPGLRQGVLYGLGVTAEKFGNENLPELWRKMIETLVNTIDAPGADVGEASSATDNGVSALGKIIRYVADPSIDKVPLVKKWISKLPLKADEEESLINMKFLVEQIQKNDPTVLGNQGENLPAIAAACATAIATESGSTSDPAEYRQLVKQMIQILDKIKQALSPQAMEQVWTSLPHLERRKLERIVANSYE